MTNEAVLLNPETLTLKDAKRHIEGLQMVITILMLERDDTEREFYVEEFNHYGHHHFKHGIRFAAEVGVDQDDVVVSVGVHLDESS